MSKKRNNSENILLPDTVVTPHGNYNYFTGKESILPALEYFRQAEIDNDRVNAVGKMLSLQAPVDPKNPNSSRPSMELFEKYAGSSDTKTNAFNAFNWKQKPRRVWDAITGRYFTLGGAISTSAFIDK